MQSVASAFASLALAISLAVPISTDAATSSITFSGPAANNGDLALNTVFKVKCSSGNLEGTGFLVSNGFVITARHVVEKCVEIELIDQKGAAVEAVKISEDAQLDLAAFRPNKKIAHAALAIAAKDEIPLGVAVAMWGFPGGYVGNTPLLSLGFVAGNDVCQGSRDRLIINGAINHGLSGGPIINTETGEVIGVSVAKIIPLTDAIKSELYALGSNPSGMQYTANVPGLGAVNFSEAQLTADIAVYLASQVQLVIGCAVKVSDLRHFVEGL